MITNGRIVAPYEPDEADRLEQDPEAGMYFSTGFAIRQAVKVTEQRVYHAHQWRREGLGWTNLSEVRVWAKTEEECKRRAEAYNDLDGKKRGLQKVAESFVAEGLKKACRELWDKAEQEYGSELDRYCIGVMEETGYSDFFCARGIHPTGLRVWPE